MRKYTVVDLFCGCGGFSSGLERAGLDIIAGIDVWDKAINTYKHNFNHIALCQDLVTFGPDEFIKTSNIKKFDILVGGPPCQGFSMAGKRDNKDPRNSLFMEFVKYLNKFKPMAFIMENVPGILSMKTAKNEKVIDIIMKHLNEYYDCKYYKLSAADFEVPQKRVRVIFIGFRKDLNIVPTQPIQILSEDKHIPVKTILLNKNMVDKKYYLSQKAIDGINRKKARMKEKKNGFGAQYLDLNKPSFTIPARYWKDGYDALVKYSENEIRRLTEKELKLVQSFPENFEILGNSREVIIQIGNAVASNFAYHLGKYMIDKLNTIEKIINMDHLVDLNEEYGKIVDGNVEELNIKMQKINNTSDDYFEILIL